MKISVVIATRNRREDLRQCINGYLKQAYTNKEIIVIDNQSTDGTREMMASEFPDIKYLWLPDNFDIRSINLGIEMSDGEIIWRTDSDSYPESENAFEIAAEIFKNHADIDIIATEDIEVSNNMIWEWYPLKVDKNNIPPGGFPAHAFPGTGAVIRRKVFDKIGGFWEFGFEEIDFCTRAIVAGFNVRYFPNIRTLHYASPSDRNNANRWVQTSKQFLRYNWRYFPFWSAFGRTTVLMFTQPFYALITRIPLSVILEGFLTLNAVIISTCRNERNVVPKDKIKDITLGVSLFSAQMKFFREIIKKKLSKWRKH
jgi:GT2 family glycosyltransferase